jgi:hypothetical protein
MKDLPKEPPPPPPQKKPYTPPALVVYGTLRELTGKHEGAGDAKGRSGIVG